MNQSALWWSSAQATVIHVDRHKHLTLKHCKDLIFITNTAKYIVKSWAHFVKSCRICKNLKQDLKFYSLSLQLFVDVFCTWVDLADQLFISSSLFIHCNVLILLHNALRKSSWHNREEIICDARGSILDEDNRSSSHISKVFHSQYFIARWRRPLQMSVL